MILKNAFLHLRGSQTVQGDLLIENGRIVAVGGTLCGDDEWDYSGKHVYPGLVDFCAPAAEETGNPILPGLDAWCGLTADTLKANGFVRQGVTSVVAIPGEHGLISGLCAVVKTWGDSMSAVTVKRDVAMKAAFTDASTAAYRPAGASKIPSGMLRMLQHALAEKSELAPVREGRLPLLMSCCHDFEVYRVLDGLQNFSDLKLIFTGCTADEKLKPVLAERGAEMTCHCPRRMAELFGVSDRIGQLQPGLDADLAIYAGDGREILLETMINGVSVYRA